MHPMKWIFLGMITPLCLTSCASRKIPQLEVLFFSAQDLNPSASRSIASKRSVEVKSYLAVNLPTKVFEKLRQDIEKSQGLSLRSRGENHITVITPPELKKLSTKVKPQEIFALAERMKVDETPYTLLCVGKGALTEKGVEESTFYVVIESDRLFQIRRAVQVLYTSKGGAAQDFEPDLYYPHVTLGFTKRDLHYEDGVVKDASSCIYNLKSEI